MTWRGTLRRLRVLGSIELLAGAQTTITQIAMDVGYSSMSAFESAFRDHVGRHPPSTATASTHDAAESSASVSRRAESPRTTRHEDHNDLTSPPTSVATSAVPSQMGPATHGLGIEPNGSGRCRRMPPACRSTRDNTKSRVAEYQAVSTISRVCYPTATQTIDLRPRSGRGLSSSGQPDGPRTSTAPTFPPMSGALCLALPDQLRPTA